MPDFSQAFVPASNSLGESIQRGITNGREWAQQKMLNQYRQQELQRQYDQIQNQMAEHKLAVMEKSSATWIRIAQTDPSKRAPLIKWATAQDQMMGIDTSQFATMAKDPNFYLDVAKPYSDYLTGLKNGSPQQISNGFQGLQNALADPTMIRTLATNAGQEMRQDQQSGVKVGGQKDVAQFKHDLGPTAAQTTKQSAGDIKDLQNHMNADSKKIDEKIRAADEAFAVFDKADKGNEAATVAAGLTFAKSVMQGQRLTQPEVKALSPMAASWYQQAVNWADKGFKGQIPAPSIDAARELLQSTQDASKQAKFDLQDQYADQYVQRAKVSGQTLSKDDAFERLTGKPYPKDNQTDIHPMDNLTDDKKAVLNQFIQKAQQNGMSSDDIKKQIKQHLGVDFGDDDIKAASKFSQNPAPASAAPELSTPAMQAPAAAAPAPDNSQPAPLPTTDQPDSSQGVTPDANP